jgi:hypothetical protein
MREVVARVRKESHTAGAEVDIPLTRESAARGHEDTSVQTAHIHGINIRKVAAQVEASLADAISAAHAGLSGCSLHAVLNSCRAALYSSSELATHLSHRTH